MELRPILSAMLRNKTGALLVGLQIALTLAVVANSVFIIVQRVEKIGRPSGMDTDNLIFVQSFGYGPQYNQLDTVRRDLDMLRAMPGVVAAGTTGAIPLSGSGSASSFGPVPEEAKINIQGNYLEVDEHAIDAFGVKLIAGRPFTQAEIQYSEQRTSEFVPSVILTQHMAKDLFGDEPALGRKVYDGLNQSAVVVGVIETMLGSWVSWDNLENVMMQPRIQSAPVLRYVVRAEPGRRDALIPEIEKSLASAGISRAVINVRPHDFYIKRSYREDSRMVTFLSILIGLMMTRDSPRNRRARELPRQRAYEADRYATSRRCAPGRHTALLHARELDAHHGWCVRRSDLAFAFGQWLSVTYSVPPLHPGYVVSGIIALWILGQLAVFVPARRAAAISPAIATRTV